MARTLEEIKKCALSQTHSCVHQPLLNIPLENIVLDELHLMLRITGVVSTHFPPTGSSLVSIYKGKLI